MKMAIKVGFVLGMVLLVCAWTLEVGAQQVRHERSKPLQEVLGLTETQLTAIGAERQAAEVQMHALREQVQKFDEEIYQAAEQTGDPATVGKLVLQKIALQKQVEAEQAAFRERLNAILTPEQQEKLKQLREADQVSRGWEALMMGGSGERLPRHEGVPGGGAVRRHRERPPEK